jgi:hypothetical protein
MTFQDLIDAVRKDPSDANRLALARALAASATTVATVSGDMVTTWFATSTYGGERYATTTMPIASSQAVPS